jgi:Replication-relaxation
MSGPFERPIASSNNGQKTAPLRANRQISPRTQRPFKRSPYITPNRLYSISHQLSDQDWTILRFVSTVRLTSGTQLTRAFWHTSDLSSSAARTARRRLAQLRRWRVLDAIPRRVGGVRAGSSSLTYTVGATGVKLLERRGETAKRLEEPGALYVAHVLDCTETLVRLGEAHRNGELDLIQAQSEPDCWRPFLGPGLRRIMLKPDLFVRIGVGDQEDRWMIEVDRATASRGALRAKCARYLAHYRTGTEQRDHGTYPRVLWTVPDTRRQEQLQELIDHQADEARRLFTVRLFDQAVPFIASEARS